MELPKTKLSIFKRVFNINENSKHVIFVLFMLLIVSLAFYFTGEKYKSAADEIEHSLRRKDSILQTAIYNIEPETKEIRQLKELDQVIFQIKEPYLYIAHRYSAYNYTFSIFFTIFSIITGILGFILVKKGWDVSKDFYLKAAFLFSFFCSTLFGLLPNVLGTKENIKNNMTKYHLYSGIQLDIYNLVSDNKGYLASNTPESKDSLNREILLITKKIKENQDLYFDIYIDRVPNEYTPLK